MKISGLKMNAIEKAFYVAGILLLVVSGCCLAEGLRLEAFEPELRAVMDRQPDAKPYASFRRSKELKETSESLYLWAFACGGLGFLTVGSIHWLCSPMPRRPQ